MAENRKAVITGGASGLGKAVALNFVDNGYDVAIIDRTSCEELAWFQNLQPGCRNSICCDISDVVAAKKAVDDAARKLGGIDVIVCAAHESLESPVEAIQEKDWDRVFQTDLIGNFFAAKAAVNYLKKSDNPSIISISSVHARIGSGVHAAYSAAMAGVAAMNRSLAAELQPLGIRCCTVSPYTVVTESVAIRLTDPEWQKLMRSTVLNDGLMRPGEFASIISYLASEKGRIFNANDLIIDGGMNVFRERPTVSAYDM